MQKLIFFLCFALYSMPQLHENFLASYIKKDEQFHREIDPEEPSPTNNIIFVGLGSHCQAAAQLNYYKLRNGAFPFDWLLTINNSDFVKILDDDFKFFLSTEYLFSHPNAPWRLENSYYKIEFRYEWPFSDTLVNEEKYNQMIAEARVKYARRIARFRKLKSYKGKAIFIRVANGLDPDVIGKKMGTLSLAHMMPYP